MEGERYYEQSRFTIENGEFVEGTPIPRGGELVISPSGVEGIHMDGRDSLKSMVERTDREREEFFEANPDLRGERGRWAWLNHQLEQTGW